MKFHTDLLDQFCEDTEWEDWKIVKATKNKLVVEFYIEDEDLTNEE